MVVGRVQLCIKLAELLLCGFLYRWQLYQLLQPSKLLQDTVHAFSTDWPHLGWLDLAAIEMYTYRAQHGLYTNQKETQ